MIWENIFSKWLFIATTSLGFLILHTIGWAFYEQQGEEKNFSLRGFTSLTASSSRYPQNNFFFTERTDSSWAGAFRLLADAEMSNNIHFELNGLQTILSTPESLLSQYSSRPTTVERSGLLSWQQHESNNSQANLTIDTVNARWSTDRIEFILGRQPINLASTFYFTPNDFFAPFAAQTFFRVYKPGVDGARFEARIGNLSQLSVIGVMGYDQDPTTGNNWSNRPDWSRASMLTRFATTIVEFEWALLGGSVRDHTIIGGSLQGELWDWLGIRGEGHYAFPEKDTEKNGSEITLGLEHRFGNSLTLRLEQFYHGKGYKSIEAVNTAIAAGQLTPGYLGKDYTAFDMSYEFSPLLIGEINILKNWTDHSQLYSINAIYSLTDESELNATVSIPIGDTPDASQVSSEFGTMPTNFTVQYRLYF